MPKGEYPFLKIGYCSFPLKDVGKKFKVVDILEIEIKKPGFMDFKKLNKYIQLHINYREIERAVWAELRKKYKKLIKNADWLVISMISEFGDKLSVSVDMLKKV
jgi:hypothetical protein